MKKTSFEGLSRRGFLRITLETATTAIIAMVLLGELVVSRENAPSVINEKNETVKAKFIEFKGEPKLAPPGAIDDFLSTCARCGICVEVCPVGVLSLYDVGYPILTKKEECISWVKEKEHFELEKCGLCVANCPTGALRGKRDYQFKWVQSKLPAKPKRWVVGPRKGTKE
ncbi:MAG: 4Fe-4S dicluster domain-containing protein [Candidatus Hydrothermarchaeota archaeon]